VKDIIPGNRDWGCERIKRSASVVSGKHGKE
jgi:hypothetical protein